MFLDVSQKENSVSVHKYHTPVEACADTLHARAGEFFRGNYSRTVNAYMEGGLPDPTLCLQVWE
jgi:hypothetical protein